MVLQLASIKSFYVGGRGISIEGLPISELHLEGQPCPYVADQNGQYQVGQLYAQSFQLMRPQFPLPILLWHGGGLTGSLWESTADGSDGWLQFFLWSGFDVIVSDAVGLGRASWGPDPAVYPNLHFRSKKELWDLLRLGSPETYHPTPEHRRAHKGTQFPVAWFDRFSMQVSPRWVGNEAAMHAAYEALVQRVGPCIIVAHSSAVRFAIHASRHTDLVKGLVAIEPSVMPLSGDMNAHPRKRERTPCLAIFGDYFQHNPYWSSILAHLRCQRERIEADLDLAWVELPTVGIYGNSHCPMSDRNAVEVASIVRDWLERTFAEARIQKTIPA